MSHQIDICDFREVFNVPKEGGEMKFIGREQELKLLTGHKKRSTSSLVTISGRRRVGKSRLVSELGILWKKNHKYEYYVFSAMPPNKKTSAQDERDEFMLQFSQQFGMPKMTVEDWTSIFQLLAKTIEGKNIIILFDEISWMGSKDYNFLGKLKNSWDLYFKQNKGLMLILCGSVSSWIEDNIINSTAFLGRLSLTLRLQPLTLKECNCFWGNNSHISAYEKLKILSITGGVPRYLELMDPKKSAEDNIALQCFTPGGILVNEFEHIFSDIFSSKSEGYQRIIKVLINGAKSQEDLRKELCLEKSGDLSRYLHELELAGFILREFTWSISSGKVSKLSNYRITDSYVRFYLKYIQPNKLKINNGEMSVPILSDLSNWNNLLGLQFESLILNNKKIIKQSLEISENSVVFDNPLFQRKTNRHKGCQIDYMIQSKFNVLFICEIKFSKHKVSADVISEVEEKIKRLYRPKGFSCRPVLIHVNGVSESVIDQQYFYKIIDFSDLLTSGS